MRLCLADCGSAVQAMNGIGVSVSASCDGDDFAAATVSDWSMQRGSAEVPRSGKKAIHPAVTAAPSLHAA